MKKLLLQFSLAMGLGITGWLIPRLLAAAKVQPGAIFLQSRGFGALIEITWVLLICTLSVFIYKAVGRTQKGILGKVFFLVLLPLLAEQTYEITIGNRYSIVYVENEIIRLDGKPYSAPVVFSPLQIDHVNIIDRSAGEEFELEFRLKNSKIYRLCVIVGDDKTAVNNFNSLVAQLKGRRVEITTVYLGRKL